jgi:hypothetical protein
VTIDLPALLGARRCGEAPTAGRAPVEAAPRRESRRGSPGVTGRLVVLWVVVAALLAAWTWAGSPPATLIAARDGAVALAAAPVAEVASTWVFWDGPPGDEAWVVLEGEAAWPRGEEPLWRRRVHPGWNQLTWNEAWRLQPGEAVQLRLLAGTGTRWGATALASSRGYGLRDLASLGGLVAALILATAVAAARAFARPGPRPSMSAWGFAVSAATALALGLRTHTLGLQSLWFDEVLTAIGAQDFTWVLYSPQIFGHPPLQYLAGWAMGGRAADEAALRLPFMLAGVATVPAVAWLGRVLLGPTTGVLAALALAVSPFHVELSQTARPYPMLLLLGTLALLALIVAVRRAEAGPWVLVTTVLAVACYTHYQGMALAAVAVPTAAALLAARRFRGWSCAAAAFGGLIVLLAPWVPVLRRLGAAQLGQGDLPASALYDLLVGAVLPQFLGPGAAAAMALGLAAVGLLSLWRQPVPLLVVLLWLAGPVLTLWLAQPRHWVAGRHLTLLLLPLILLVAAGAVRVVAGLARLAAAILPRPGWSTAAGAVVGGLVVLLWLGPSIGSLRDYYAGRLGFDWRLVANVLEHAIPEDAPVLATAGAAYPLRHYWRSGIEVLEPSTFRRQLEDRRSGPALWVVTHEGWDRPPDLGEWLEAHAIAVAEVPASWSLPGVRVWRVRGAHAPPRGGHARPDTGA